MEPSSPVPAPDPARRAARQLEAAFAAEMIRSARPPRREGLTGRGPGTTEFDTFMNEALGQAMASRGALGLARPIEEAIRRQQSAARPRP